MCRKISLRTFLVFVVVLGTIIGVLYRTNSSRKFAQQQLIENGFSIGFGSSDEIAYALTLGRTGGLFDEPVENDFLKFFRLEALGHEPTVVIRLWNKEAKLENQEFGVTDVRPLQVFSKVEYLDLSWNPIADDGLESLSHLSHLKTLHLTGTNVSDNGIAVISNLQSLGRLSLDDTLVSNYAMSIISKLKNLKHLSLNNTNLSDDGVALISKNSSLRLLSLRGTNVTGTSFENFEKNSNLEVLDLGETKFEQRYIKHLLRLFPNLEELYLDGTSIDDSEDLICNFKKLENLSVSNTKIGDAFISTLEFSSIYELLINSTNVTDASAELLKSMTRLGRIEARETKITSQELDEIEDLLFSR